MKSARRTAVATGVFFLITEVTAIAGLALYAPVLNGADYITGSGSDARVFWGAMMEVFLAIAIVATGATLYPILKKQNAAAAMGYVCGRLLEAAVIVVGIISVLSGVTLRQDLGAAEAAGTDSTTLSTVGRALVAFHDWTFLMGPGLLLGANTLVLAYLMYSSGLVPRVIATLGLVGGALIFGSATAVMFGLYEQLSVWGSIAALPIFAWEVSLAVWLIAKGFRPLDKADASRRNVGVESISPAP
ncbi:DUF4386 domain-containing protein [Arthrobacter sp. ISL-30]|uniref:DUF4386 domain-containing protein n=1 Tax=Arthrobacter sp. ISL-30 TaxID=2819109 RepID=UPI001BE9C37B|nr:DUF4386 domain-containing protein [Arthrobacter sp. ISL-30]MBT2515433.1 DUF4386 domain-containing protein [Arthrobacter sp. ISL-30]